MHQETGVPQGSVLSVTLFALKIDEIATTIPNEPNFHSSLFVDDLQVSYMGYDLNIIKYKLQLCLNNIVKWANNNSYRFSQSKTKAVHFTKIPGLHIQPNLYINNQMLNYADSIKFLGLIWDSKLTWKSHIKTLKTNCNKSINLIRSITAQKWGADTDTIMLHYRALIRSKLDYGCIVYSSACPTTLKTLDVIANDIIRIATGAFRTTPTATLNILADEMPLSLRRSKLSLQYYFKIRSFINNPAHPHVTDLSNLRLFSNKNMPVPFSIRIYQLMNELQIFRRGIKPTFSYTIHDISIPTYAIEPPDVNTELAI
uniref:Pol-like protein n=1 Tax=Hirondellea gigas TaxID=1518452 RepID=A0A2P2I0Q3_9CRUS